VPLEQLYYAFGSSPLINVVGQLLNVFAGVLAGYLAARFAGSAPLLHAAVATVPMYIAILTAYLGVYPSPYPLWSNVLALLLPLPCALMGANLWRRSLNKV
jgi:hypothetical protein